MMSLTKLRAGGGLETCASRPRSTPATDHPSGGQLLGLLLSFRGVGFSGFSSAVTHKIMYISGDIIVVIP